MEELKIPLVVVAAIVGGLVGLYLYGKKMKKKGQTSISPSGGKIKVSGNDWNDLVNKMKEKGFKNKVEFEFLPIFTYENLVTWINEIDLKDAQEDADVYGCLLMRSLKEIDKFNIDIETLTEEQKGNLYGALIVNTKSNEILHQRWIVADSIDDDLSDSFNGNDLIILK